MQFVQLPKLNFRFKKILTQPPIDISTNELKNLRMNFNELIPDKVSKQVQRMKRIQIKESATDISLKNGAVLKMSSLLNMKSESKGKISSMDTPGKSVYSLRKMRIESAISTELINFFSSSSAPKLLRNDFSLWSIDSV